MGVNDYVYYALKNSVDFFFYPLFSTVDVSVVMSVHTGCFRRKWSMD